MPPQNDEAVWPVLMLETETGDISIVDSRDGLVLSVEEFWDILEKDFHFWDSRGRRLRFEEVFLRDPSRGVLVSPQDETSTVLQHIAAYVSRRGIKVDLDVDATGLGGLYQRLEFEDQGR